MAVVVNSVQLLVAGEVSRAGVSVGADIIKVLKCPENPLSLATEQSIYRVISSMKKCGLLKDVEPSELKSNAIDNGQTKKIKPVALTDEGNKRFELDLEDSMTKVLRVDPDPHKLLSFARYIPDRPIDVQVSHLQKIYRYRNDVLAEIDYLERTQESADGELSTNEKFNQLENVTSLAKYRDHLLPLVDGVIEILIDATPELANVSP